MLYLLYCACGTEISQHFQYTWLPGTKACPSYKSKMASAPTHVDVPPDAKFSAVQKYMWCMNIIVPNKIDKNGQTLIWPAVKSPITTFWGSTKHWTSRLYALENTGHVLLSYVSVHSTSLKSKVIFTSLALHLQLFKSMQIHFQVTTGAQSPLTTVYFHFTLLPIWHHFKICTSLLALPTL